MRLFPRRLILLPFVCAALALAFYAFEYLARKVITARIEKMMPKPPPQHPKK